MLTALPGSNIKVTYGFMRASSVNVRLAQNPLCLRMSHMCERRLS